MHLFQHSLLHGSQHFQRYTCSRVALPIATVPSEVNLLQHGPTYGCSAFRALHTTCSVVDVSMVARFEVLYHNLMHSCSCFKMYLLQYGLFLNHRYFEMHVLQSGLILQPQSLQGHTWCNIDTTMVTEAFRCTRSGMGLSTATDALGYPVPMWSHPQLTVTLTQVHTSIPVCPYSSRETAEICLKQLDICHPRRVAIGMASTYQNEK